MKPAFIRPLLLLLLALGLSTSLQAQKKKYQAIQGLGYLHTQITILIDNWATHPLNEGSVDEFTREFRDHFVEEIQHDEEWVEFMLVEDNLLFGFEEHISAEVEEALESNIEFYDKVIEMIQTPEEMSLNLEALQNELEDADARLYDVIYPALCK